MKQIFIAAIVSLVAGQAAALSCMQADPVATYNRLAADEATYYVLYGTLDFDAKQQPQGVVNEERNPAPIAAKFTGMGLSETGFDRDFSRDVTVQPLCAGPWCGNAPVGIASLIFGEVVGDDIIIAAEPCGGMIFSEPTQAVRDSMTACMGGDCVSAQPLQ